jgi:hypothetical protein
LKLSGRDVAMFFEPSVQCIVETVGQMAKPETTSRRVSIKPILSPLFVASLRRLVNVCQTACEMDRRRGGEGTETWCS